MESAPNPIFERTVSYYHMKKSWQVVRIMLDFYCPMYGVPPEKLNKLVPILYYVECVVYDMDKAVEDGQQSDKHVSLQGEIDRLESVLETENLLCDAVKEEIKQLVSYFNLETDIVIASKKHVTNQDILEYTLEDVKKAWKLRSSDFRILAAIILQFVDLEPNPSYATVLDSLYLWIEVASDVPDVLKDFEANQFNTFNLYHQMYGDKWQAKLQEELLQIKTTTEELIAKTPIKMILFQLCRQWWGRVPLPLPPIETLKAIKKSSSNKSKK